MRTTTKKPCAAASVRYPHSILEEELKNRVAADWFNAFDCSRILGKVDFCAAAPATELPLCDAESVVWAEAKRGADAPLDFALVQSPNFKAFRQAFHGKLEKCFVVPADTFDNVKGDFPIGFFVWQLTGEAAVSAAEANRRQDGDAPSQNGQNARSPSDVFTSTMADVYGRNGEFTGTKTILSYDNERSINDWLIETRKRPSQLQLGFLSTRAHDVQDINTIYIKRDKALIKSPRGSWITDANITESAVYVAICHSIEVDWLNDRDQFLYPTDGWKADAEFQSDCLVFTLFHGQNRISSRDGINHWIPFTEQEVGAKDCFASHFMSDWLAGRGTARSVIAPYQEELDFSGATGTRDESPMSPLSQMSQQARAVLDAGRELWRYYHAQPNANPNASYYDIRLHFQGTTTDAKGKVKMKSDSADATYATLIADLRAAMKSLAKRIEPKVYEYGFLKR